jgi:hypothetical protein
VIYAAFALWVFLILFMAIGVHALLSRMVKPAWASWALLPGTIVAEMAYIFGSLVTGGEIKHAKLLPGKTANKKADLDPEPATETNPRLKVIGPTVAALMAVFACGAGIVLAHAFLGQPVVGEFIGGWPASELEKTVPTSMPAFWDQIERQTWLLKRMTQTWGDVDWLDWRVPVFVYLTICFSVRLAPGKRDLRYTLLAVLILTGLIALIGAVSSRFGDLMQTIWPLLTYIWTILLFLLGVTLIIHGLICLIRILAGKTAKTGK